MEVIKKIALLSVLFMFSSSIFSQEQYHFTALELEMDRIAIRYGADRSEQLEQLKQLLVNNPQATAAEKALFSTFSCSLKANLAPTLAEESLAALKDLMYESLNDNSVKAAVALCEASLAQYVTSSDDYDVALYKAFLFSQLSDLATLRYWIGLNINDTFIQYNDLKSSELALLTALGVAIDNNDDYRVIVSSMSLIHTYRKQGKYDLAIEYANLAQESLNNLDDNWLQDQVYIGRAATLQSLNKYDDALFYYKKALVNAKEQAKYREVKFLQLDIAFVKLMLKKPGQANKGLEEVMNYSLEYDDQFLLHQAKLLQSHIYLFEGLGSKSTQLFNQVINYLQRENYPKELLNAWQQLIQVAKLSENQVLERKSLQRYNALLNERTVNERAVMQGIITKAHNGIRVYDVELAAHELKRQSVLQKELLSNRDQLLASTIFLAALLAIIGVRFGWRRVASYRRRKAEICRQRYYDPLTQCFNRRYLNEVIVSKLISSSKAGNSGVLVMIDIDHFKQFNDTYGHAAGDNVLKEVVKTLQADLRPNDNIVRLGGEEFLMVLPPSDNLNVEAVIERILQVINRNPVIIEDKPRRVTISIGYIPVEKVNSAVKVEELLILADKALYHAKECGRNRAVGISELQCSANAIDNIVTAKNNGLLKLSEIRIDARGC